MSWLDADTLPLSSPLKPANVVAAYLTMTKTWPTLPAEGRRSREDVGAPVEADNRQAVLDRHLVDRLVTASCLNERDGAWGRVEPGGDRRHVSDGCNRISLVPGDQPRHLVGRDRHDRRWAVHARP